ncbi:MAG: hypothetical protein EZS28_004157 [Streblomastix strix]|uniref:Uncharacterized protein n=1 Tax=Streblomastix strix TaxID=222440 RepID=A0A5J4WZF5_9EUKA|nr:MAG: hypothetical protein EZS28_004157 [Streblomastix strix]
MEQPISEIEQQKLSTPEFGASNLDSSQQTQNSAEQQVIENGSTKVEEKVQLDAGEAENVQIEYVMPETDDPNYANSIVEEIFNWDDLKKTNSRSFKSPNQSQQRDPTISQNEQQSTQLTNKIDSESQTLNSQTQSQSLMQQQYEPNMILMKRVEQGEMIYQALLKRMFQQGQGKLDVKDTYSAQEIQEFLTESSRIVSDFGNYILNADFSYQIDLYDHAQLKSLIIDMQHDSSLSIQAINILKDQIIQRDNKMNTQREYYFKELLKLREQLLFKQRQNEIYEVDIDNTTNPRDWLNELLISEGQDVVEEDMMDLGRKT